MDQDISNMRYLVRYEGSVQGVGFRFNAVRQCAGLSVNGFVRNEPDGSVLMDVEGKTKDLQQLLKRIKASMAGNIEAVQLDERPPRGIAVGFKIED